MKKRTDIDVIINNKRYTLCGYESEEYLQKIASYINGKYAELKTQESYRILDSDMKNVLMQINLADDYFKAKKLMEDTEQNSDTKSNEIYDLKREIIALQSKLEAAGKEINQLKKENIEEQKKVVRLETELEGRQSDKRNKAGY